MKYVVILGDGMADEPLDILGGKTPLDVAKKPNTDRLASLGETGMVKTVPDHLSPPGSDIANMSVLGYNPDEFYTGRSPLEAVSMGISMQDSDLAIRTNLVSLQFHGDPSLCDCSYEDATMLDYSSGEISSDEARELIEFLQKELIERGGYSDKMRLYAGVSYRHCLIYRREGSVALKCTPPHDITNKPIKNFLPAGDDAELLLDIMKKSRELLFNHPVNISRRERGLNTADTLWFWGEGRKPDLADFKSMRGIRGGIISAVDLVKGLGFCANMDVLQVPNVTGTIDTDFDGKCAYAIEYLLGNNAGDGGDGGDGGGDRVDYGDGEDGDVHGDFTYVHMEAPDECGHQGDVSGKIRSIELIDEKVVGPIVRALENNRTQFGEDFTIAILPDHPTPIDKRTHTHEAVPYVIYKSADAGSKNNDVRNASIAYSEADGRKSGILIDPGYQLMNRILSH